MTSQIEHGDDVMSTVDVLWVVTLAFPDGGGVLITVCVLMWPPNAKLPRNAPAVLNDHYHARLDMSWSSLGVVLRGLLHVDGQQQSPFDENAASVVQ